VIGFSFSHCWLYVGTPTYTFHGHRHCEYQKPCKNVYTLLCRFCFILLDDIPHQSSWPKITLGLQLVGCWLIPQRSHHVLPAICYLLPQKHWIMDMHLWHAFVCMVIHLVLKSGLTSYRSIWMISCWYWLDIHTIWEKRMHHLPSTINHQSHMYRSCRTSVISHQSSVISHQSSTTFLPQWIDWEWQLKGPLFLPHHGAWLNLKFAISNHQIPSISEGNTQQKMSREKQMINPRPQGSKYCTLHTWDLLLVFSMLLALM